MMTATKAREKLAALRQNEKEVDRIVGWLGGRVLVELDHIIGRSLSYYPFLADLPDIQSEKQRRLWSFLLAASELRERLPHNSKFLAQRADERAAKKGRSPFAGWSTARRIASDYEIISGMLDDGMSYEQAAKEIARRNHVKYFRHTPKEDNLRKVMKKLGYVKKPQTI